MPEASEWQGEFRVIGPPGCGKTTYLAGQVNRALAEGRRVSVSSLTHAAAEEIAGTTDSLYEWEVGTLHSHAYHALDRPELAHSVKRIKEWNELYPEWAMNTGKPADVDQDNLSPGFANPGDRLMNRWQAARSLSIPEDRMRPETAEFGRAWESWKAENGIVDFTDLIRRCIEEIPEAPGEPEAIFVDESQDLDFQEAALLRKWGQAAGELTLVGDPDQNLYGWRGSDSRAFIEPPLPERNWTILSQSYRLPVRVHAAAIQWIRQTPGRLKDPHFDPTGFEGELRQCRSSWFNPELAAEEAERHIEAGRTVMFVASCNYMLQPLTDILKKRGVPFHNPQRPQNGAWNPIRKKAGQRSSAERLASFLRLSSEGCWTADELRDWTEAVKKEAASGVKGLRNRVKELKNDQQDEGYPPCLSYRTLEQLLRPEAIEAGMSGDTGWYYQNLTKSRQKPTEYPLEIVKRRGVEALLSEPPVILGTIHSVKGGEADAVYLFPGLSKAGAGEWQGGPRKKAGVYRMFYVGMTRARQSLNLCRPGSEFFPRNLPLMPQNRTG